eukprot:1160428-Pelagomonas_calceolata.AAC.15
MCSSHLLKYNPPDPDEGQLALQQASPFPVGSHCIRVKQTYNYKLYTSTRLRFHRVQTTAFGPQTRGVAQRKRAA